MLPSTYSEFIDHADKVANVQPDADPGRKSNEKVLGLRFKLGADDDARYLNAGVAMLWSCIDEQAESGLSSVLESLHSVDTADVTRRATERALQASNTRKAAESAELRAQVWAVIGTLKSKGGTELERQLNELVPKLGQALPEGGTPSPEQLLAICQTLLEVLEDDKSPTPSNAILKDEEDDDGESEDNGEEGKGEEVLPPLEAADGGLQANESASAAVARCAELGLVGVRGPHQPAPTDTDGKNGPDGRVVYAHPKLQDSQLHARLRLLDRVCARRGMAVRPDERRAASSEAFDERNSFATIAAELAVEAHGHFTNRGFASSRYSRSKISEASDGTLEPARFVRWMPRPRCAISKLVATAAALEHEHLAKAAIVDALAPTTTAAAPAGDAPTTTVVALRTQSVAAKLRQIPLLQWLSALSSDESALVEKLLAPHAPMVTRPCYVDRNGKLYTSGLPMEVCSDTDKAKVEECFKGNAFGCAARAARTSANPATGTFTFSEASFGAVGLDGAKPATAVPTAALSDGEIGMIDDLQRQAQRVLEAANGGGDGERHLDLLFNKRVRAILQLGVRVATEELAVQGAIARAERASERAKDADKDAAKNPVLQRRSGLWAEFLRSLAIGNDPLWVFVKTLSGFLGEDINSVITMADDAAIRASRAIEQQKLAIAKRVSETQARIVETIVTALAKDSRLAFDKNSAGALVVVDNETRAQLKEIASGTSGRPFFEASQALHALRAGDASKQTTLEALLADVTNAGHAIQSQLIENMAGLTDATASGFGAGMASLAELSQPHNSYFVNMKPDVVAALKSAHEKLSVEMAFQGVRDIRLWELIEGGCDDLSARFAEATALVLAQLRASGGVNAMYVPKHAIETNALQARMAMAKLSNLATAYAMRVSAPSTTAGDGADKHIEERNNHVKNAKRVRARDALAIAGIDPSATRHRGRGAKRPLPYGTPEAGGRWLGYH